MLKIWRTGELLLFSLADDIGERRNLANAMPDKAKDLHAKLTTYLASVKAEDWRDIRKVLGRAAGGLEIRRRIDSDLKQAEQDSAQELRKRIEQLEGQLAEQDRIRRESVHSQKPGANRAWAR